MSKRSYITRYLLIIKCLKNNNYSTWQELQSYIESQADMFGVEKEDKLPLSERTILRDLEEIERLFGVEISNKRNEGYYLSDEDKTKKSDITRILDEFEMYNFKIFTRQSNSTNIHFENRRPQGADNLFGLYHAILHNNECSFSYEDYWQDDLCAITIEPYALKEFKNRWYVLAKNIETGNIKNYALERISSLSITDKRFTKPANFSIEQYYEHCFGITPPNEEEPQEVVLWFNKRQGRYVKSLPLHSSQTIDFEDEDSIQIRLKIFISYEFKMELLSYGDEVQILEPQSLVDEIKEIYTSALQQYN